MIAPTNINRRICQGKSFDKKRHFLSRALRAVGDILKIVFTFCLLCDKMYLVKIGFLADLMGSAKSPFLY